MAIASEQGEADRQNRMIQSARGHDKGTPGYTEFSDPFYLLKISLEDHITVILQSSAHASGLLADFDEHMNLVLINAEEVAGQVRRFFPLLFIRGDTIIFVTRSKLKV